MSQGSENTLAWVFAEVYRDFTEVIFYTGSLRKASVFLLEVSNTLLHSVFYRNISSSALP